jgi:hypothetical protein
LRIEREQRSQNPEREREGDSAQRKLRIVNRKCVMKNFKTFPASHRLEIINVHSFVFVPAQRPNIAVVFDSGNRTNNFVSVFDCWTHKKKSAPQKEQSRSQDFAIPDDFSASGCAPAEPLSSETVRTFSHFPKFRATEIFGLKNSNRCHLPTCKRAKPLISLHFLRSDPSKVTQSDPHLSRCHFPFSL